jgi:hypothetical protein
MNMNQVMAAVNNGGILVCESQKACSRMCEQAHRDWAFKPTSRYDAVCVIPKTKWAKRVWLKGQIRYFKRAGLSDQQATALARSRLPLRHALANLVAEIIGNKWLRQAVLAYPIGGTQDDRRRWRRCWEACFPAALPDDRRMTAVARMVRLLSTA